MATKKEKQKTQMPEPYKLRAKVTVHEDYVTLRIDDTKFIAKNPRVQPFHSYRYNSPKDIMYFYYDWIMYRKHERGWRRVHTSSVYEFGIMSCLEENIQELLDLDCRKKGIRTYFNRRNQDGTIVQSRTEFQAIYPFEIGGLFNEDVFNFTKYYKTFTDCRGKMEFEFYDLSIFIGGNECGKTALGVQFPHLAREDVEVVKQFAHEFMELTNRITKAQINRYLDDDVDSEYNYAKQVRLHLLNKYGITDWKPIFIRLNDEEYVIDEYLEYINGEKTADEIRCHEWHGEKRTMAQMLQVMPDYAAFMHVLDDNHQKG